MNRLNLKTTAARPITSTLSAKGRINQVRRDIESVHDHPATVTLTATHRENLGLICIELTEWLHQPEQRRLKAAQQKLGWIIADVRQRRVHLEPLLFNRLMDAQFSITDLLINPPVQGGSHE